MVDAAIADRKAGKTRPALGESDLLDMMLSVRRSKQPPNHALATKRMFPEAIFLLITPPQRNLRPKESIKISSAFFFAFAVSETGFFVSNYSDNSLKIMLQIAHAFSVLVFSNWFSPPLQVRYEDGSSMPDKQVRDEAMTFVLAGHESMARLLLLFDFLALIST